VPRPHPARCRHHPPPHHAAPHRPSRPGQAAKREGRRWPDPGQAQAQLAAARPRHHPLLPAGQTRPFPALLCVAWKKKKDEKRMLQTYVFHVFRMFQRYLQVFRIGVVKVDRDIVKVYWNVAHVAMVIHVCFKCMFQMFHLYQTYVAIIFIWMLQK
jgi:hypothetical protein